MDGAEISSIIQKARYALWAPCSLHPLHQLFLFIILLIGLGILLDVPSHGGMTTFASPKSRPSPRSVPQLFVQANEVPMLFWMLMRNAAVCRHYIAWRMAGGNPRSWAWHMAAVRSFYGF